MKEKRGMKLKIEKNTPISTKNNFNVHNVRKQWHLIFLLGSLKFLNYFCSVEHAAKKDAFYTALQKIKII